MRTARSLIFAHLGLALACKNTKAVPDAEPIATVAPTPTPTPTPIPIPTPSASVAIPPPSASASGSAKPTTIPIDVVATLPPGRCRTVADCPGGRSSCDRSGVAATDLGFCRTIMIRQGRPLVVDGEVHVSSMDAAGDEHASIAAFARTICELMALGAPLDLIRDTQEALADEIRHTEMTLAHVPNTRIGALPAATAPLARAPSDFFRDVFRGGAIGETRAAERAERERDEATDPEMRAFYDTIVVDESKHAALAFRTLRWMLSAMPELSRVRDEEIARAPIDPLFDVLRCPDA